VIIYSCVLTIYLIRFSDYIIDQHNRDDSPQSETVKNTYTQNNQAAWMITKPKSRMRTQQRAPVHIMSLYVLDKASESA
jgi:hypothetical protein